MDSDSIRAISNEARPTRPGRPRKLTEEAVLDAALELLTEIPLEAFTLAKLAQKVGASTMSLYTYFASRDALLEAVADRAFRLFAVPDREGPWQDQILAWLWALKAHVDCHPVATKLMAWTGRVPMAWLRIWAPILRLLHEQGLEGARLAVTFDWFINAAIGLIITEQRAAEISKTAAVVDIGALAQEDGILLLRFLYDLQSIDDEARFTLGFRRLLDGLQSCIDESRPGDAALEKTPAS
jgi:AcrR family transcriptional regulator